MKKTDIKIFLTYLAVILTGFMLFGCGAKKIPTWGNEKVGFNLQYQLDNGQKLNYETSGKSMTNLDLMGNATISNDDTLIQFSMVGTQANNPDQLSCQVTIDDMKMKSIQSAMGESGELERDLSKVIGKSFDLTISPQGKEIELSGIDDLTIDMGSMGGGKRSMRNQFGNILPDLSDSPIKIGETWTSTDENLTPSGMGDAPAKVLTNTTSKIEGYDIIDGYECLRISSQTTGTIEGEGETMNAPVVMKGNLTTKTTWYFAYKKGLLVKSLTDYKMKTDIKIGGDDGMKILLNVESEAETKLTTPAS